MNYYQILNIAVEATQEQIRSAYRKKAKELHPDLNRHIDPKQMQELNEAYATLSDPEKRNLYDFSMNLFTSRPSRQSRYEYTHVDPREPKRNPRYQNQRADTYSNEFWKGFWDININYSSYHERGSTKTHSFNRKPLSVARIKAILREEIGQKREQRDSYRIIKCDFCDWNTPPGDVFYRMMGPKNICKACWNDILKHL